MTTWTAPAGPPTTLYTEQDRPVGAYAGAVPSVSSPVSLIAHSTSEVPLTLKGAPSQSAALLLFKDSADVVKSSVLYDGTIVVGPAAHGAAGGTGIFGETVAPLVGSHISSQAQATNIIPLLLTGYVGQSVDLLRIQDGGSTVIARVLPGGGGVFDRNGTDGSAFGGLDPLANVSVAIGTVNAARIPLVARAAASQTASIQEWQDSAGTKVAKISKDGSFVNGTMAVALANASGAAFFGPANAPVIGYQGYVASSAANIVPFALVGAASQTANLLELKNSASTILARIDKDGEGLFSGGGVRTPFLQDTTVTGAYLATSAAGMGIVNRGASAVPLFIRGAASQSADLQQWQNSAGTVLTNISSGGVLRTQDFYANGAVNARYSTYQGSALAAQALNATEIGAIIQGAASQSANLQEWQNSAAAVLASISNFGRVYGRQLFGEAFDAATIGAIIKGAASQSASLQEWQNSAGTALMTVTKDGDLSGISGAFLGNSGYIGSRFSVKPSSASEKGSVVRGFASQTANLAEFQNSSAAALAFIRPDGSMHMDRWDVQPVNPATIASLIVGAAAQTASLLELRDSGSNVLSYIGANGRLHQATYSGLAGGQTGLYISYVGNANTADQQVTVGAVDSGGAGFRVLRVPN